MDVSKAFVLYCDAVKLLRGVQASIHDEWTYQDLFHLACGIEGMAGKGWDRIVISISYENSLNMSFQTLKTHPCSMRRLRLNDIVSVFVG